MAPYCPPELHFRRKSIPGKPVLLSDVNSADFVISFTFRICIAFSSIMSRISMPGIWANRRILWPLWDMIHLLMEVGIEPIRGAEVFIYENTYLLSLHWRIAIYALHLTIHLLLRSTVRSGWSRLDLGCVHI